MLKCVYQLPPLPPPGELETRDVLRACATAHRKLAEVKGRAHAIPNQSILIDTLALQEAKASSEIENIVTTQDELFQADLIGLGGEAGPAKEVARYREALKLGYARSAAAGGVISNNLIIEMFRVLKGSQEGFRSVPGTALRNDRSGEIVYVPPQSLPEIREAMGALESFINDDARSVLDPLIKMAVIHHQFESIHPFSDGNGRVGRILNVLYLTRAGLLETPILYLSRAINRSKPTYYRLLQHVRDTGDWEPWLIYILEAVSETSGATLELIEGIRILMADYKRQMRDRLPKIYSQDLLNNLFRHPYTRIDFVQSDLSVTRQTAARYLDQLAEQGLVAKHQAWRTNYYVNEPLVSLFMRVSG